MLYPPEFFHQKLWKAFFNNYDRLIMHLGILNSRKFEWEVKKFFMKSIKYKENVILWNRNALT